MVTEMRLDHARQPFGHQSRRVDGIRTGARRGRRSALPVVVRGALSDERVAQLLELGAANAVTYDHVGASLRGRPPRHGFSADRVVGSGPDAFDAARRSLQMLVPQRSVATVHPGDARVSDGATVLVALRLGPVTVVAVNRVVAVVDEQRRWGFAYGTLPGHPESGEEAFEVVHRDDDSVVARITVDAVPALPALIARLVAHPTRWASRHYAHRYLDAIFAAVGAG